MPEFNSLKQPPFSEYWDEEEDFSEWLAAEDNIHHLQEVLGLQGLVAEEREREVEGYFVDIFARDETFGIEVVVENQFGRSDHDHWGKANTYSANLDTDVIVWIAGEFTDGHLKAVRDHNDTADRAVFALRAEVIEIEGCDRAAFQLVPAAEPTDWPYGGDVERGVYQEYFFEQFVSFVEKEGHEIFASDRVHPYSSSTPHVYHLPISEDISTGDYRISLRATGTGLAVRLEIDKDDDHAAFDTFDANRQEINEELHSRISGDAKIVWDRGSEDKIRDVVSLQYSEGEFDLRAVNRYDSYHRWLLSATAALHSVFADRIQQQEK